jgi:hypothetical protein
MVEFFISLTGDDNNVGDESNPFLTLPYAISQVDDGDTINIADGTYELTSVLIINKELHIIGNDKDTTIIEGTFSTAQNSSLISITSNNVKLKNITFKQLASAVNFCITGQTSDPNRPGDSVKIENFSLEDSIIEYPKHGVSIRGVNTIIKNVNFK